MTPEDTPVPCVLPVNLLVRQPARELLGEAAVGREREVQRERREAGRAVVERVRVGSRVALVAYAGAAKPEVRAAARVDAEVDELLVNARAEARRADLAGPRLRHVEVHERGARERSRAEEVERDPRRELRHGL